MATDDPLSVPYRYPVVPSNSTKAERILNLATIVASVGAGLVLLLFEPTASSFFPKCSMYSLTGLHCPGCGSQRAIHHLLNGRLALAMHYNSMVVLTSPWILAAGVSWTIRVWELPGIAWLRRQRWHVPGKTMIAIGTLIVVFGLVRNIPFEPFTWIAPPGTSTASQP